MGGSGQQRFLEDNPPTPRNPFLPAQPHALELVLFCSFGRTSRIKRLLLPEGSSRGFTEPLLSRGVEAANHMVLTLIHSTDPSEHPIWAGALHGGVRRPMGVTVTGEVLD